MGKGIVYCAECGKSLREDEFQRGKAHTVDDMPYCVDCKPLSSAPAPRPATPQPGAVKKGSSQRLKPPEDPEAREGSSKRLPRVPSTARVAMAKPPLQLAELLKSPIVAGGAIALVVVILLVVLLAGGSGSRPLSGPVNVEPPPERATTSRPPPVNPNPNPSPPQPIDPALEALKELEAYAAAIKDPDAVLARADRLRAHIAGSKHEARMREIEDRAKETKLLRERQKLMRVDPYLAEIRKIEGGDPRFERKQEVLEKFAQALSVANGRRGEVEKLRDAYLKKAEEAADRAALVGHWKFDDGKSNVAEDASGREQKGQVRGAAWNAGKIGGALSFDGVDDYVELPHTPALSSVQGSNYTLSAWFKPEGTPQGKDAEYGILVKAGWHEGLSYNSESKFAMHHWLVKDVHVGTTTGARVFPPGVWYHVVGVVNRSAGATELYVNGKRSGRADWESNSDSRGFGASTWKIGIGDPGNPKWAWPAKGIIDDVRIFNRALTLGEVLEIYQAGTAGKEK